jgi:hypothetical protein
VLDYISLKDTYDDYLTYHPSEYRIKSLKRFCRTLQLDNPAIRYYGLQDSFFIFDPTKHLHAKEKARFDDSDSKESQSTDNSDAEAQFDYLII